MFRNSRVRWRPSVNFCAGTASNLLGFSDRRCRCWPPIAGAFPMIPPPPIWTIGRSSRRTIPIFFGHVSILASEGFIVFTMATSHPAVQQALALANQSLQLTRHCGSGAGAGASFPSRLGGRSGCPEHAGCHPLFAGPLRPKRRPVRPRAAPPRRANPCWPAIWAGRWPGLGRIDEAGEASFHAAIKLQAGFRRCQI